MVDRSRLDTKIQTCAHRSCISVHGVFPFNPTALQARELVSRGTALCYRAKFATERPPAEPALLCLAYPPTLLYIYMYIYVYESQACVHVNKYIDGSPSTDSLFRAFMPLYIARASLGQGGIHRGRKRRGDAPTRAHTVPSNTCSMHAYVCVCVCLSIFVCTFACKGHVRPNQQPSTREAFVYVGAARCAYERNTLHPSNELCHP